MLLRPHQVEPANRLASILRTHDSAVDCSDTGTGKTFVAVAVAAALKLPTLMVVPKISITAWHRVAEMFGEEFSIINYEILKGGNTEYGTWEHQDRVNEGRQSYFVCQCCQQRIDLANPGNCYAHPLGIHCVEEKKKAVSYGRFSFHRAVGAVVFDEAHRCGGIGSLNAEMMIATKRQRIKMLGLSATLACDPMKLRALGYSLDLHADKYDLMNIAGSTFRRPNFYRWAATHGCRKIPPLPGIRWAVGAERQKAIMASIRSEIIPARGVRVTTAEIPGFPERQITAELYDLEQNGQIDKLYREMESAIVALNAKAASDKAPDHPLTIFLRAHQRIELLKVPIAVELTQDALEKGLSVGIFVNFSQTIDELSRRLGCADIIDGRNLSDRQGVIDRFELDEARLVLVNSEAGGICVNLQDVRGFFPRVGFIFPGFKAATFLQVCGRFHRVGGLTKCFYRVLLAANTVERDIYRNLRGKLDNLSALNDADLRPDNLPLVKITR